VEKSQQSHRELSLGLPVYDSQLTDVVRISEELVGFDIIEHQTASTLQHTKVTRHCPKPPETISSRTNLH
jgi:hypothetical protein